MELASHEHNFYSGAIVGGSLYMPLGGAFAQKYRGIDDISISIIGDGAVSSDDAISRTHPPIIAAHYRSHGYYLAKGAPLEANSGEERRPAQSAKNEPFVGDFRLYFRGPKTSRNTTLKSSSARAQSPVKLEPCMMASVLGFRSASFFKFPAVSGV